jgi:hypothetical protein
VLLREKALFLGDQWWRHNEPFLMSLLPDCSNIPQGRTKSAIKEEYPTVFYDATNNDREVFDLSPEPNESTVDERIRVFNDLLQDSDIPLKFLRWDTWAEENLAISNAPMIANSFENQLEESIRHDAIDYARRHGSSNEEHEKLTLSSMNFLRTEISGIIEAAFNRRIKFIAYPGSQLNCMAKAIELLAPKFNSNIHWLHGNFRFLNYKNVELESSPFERELLDSFFPTQSVQIGENLSPEERNTLNNLIRELEKIPPDARINLLHFFEATIQEQSNEARNGTNIALVQS